MSKLLLKITQVGSAEFWVEGRQVGECGKCGGIIQNSKNIRAETTTYEADPES